MRELTHASLFAGIGGIDEAAHRAGFRTIWGCEIDERCQNVLRYHFPTVPWLGDVEDVMDVIDRLRSPDVVSAGSPCQGLSMAGRQEGLEDERSGLFIRFADILSMTDARFGVWENVPGALTSNNGEDFATVLEMLLEVEPGTIGVLPKAKGGRRGRFAGYAEVEDGRSLAWRVLDAQYLGVPQRRERIVLVVDKEGTTAPADVLFPDLSAEEIEATIGSNLAVFLFDDIVDKGASLGITRPDLVDLLEDDVDEKWYLSKKAANGVLERTQRRRERTNSNKVLPPILETALRMTAGWPVPDELAQTCMEEMVERGCTVDRDVNNAVVNKWYRGTSGPSGDEHHNLVAQVYPDPAGTITRRYHKSVNTTLDDGAVVATYSITPLSGQGADLSATEIDTASGLTVNAMEKVTDRGTRIVTARKPKRARSNTDNESWVDDSIANTLNTFDIGDIRDTNLAIELPELRVRRLTPLEAERLMGLDDNWTNIPGSTNTTRFKQIGNSVAVPVFQYVFEQLRTVTEGTT